MKNEKIIAPPALGQRTKEFSLRIIKMFAALPKSMIAQVMGNQVLRSGTSVGANYREANRARSKGEFIAKMVTVSKKSMRPATGWNCLGNQQQFPKENYPLYLMKHSNSWPFLSPF